MDTETSKGVPQTCSPSSAQQPSVVGIPRAFDGAMAMSMVSSACDVRHGTMGRFLGQLELGQKISGHGCAGNDGRVAGNLQGTCRELAGNLQGSWKQHGGGYALDTLCFFF